MSAFCSDLLANLIATVVGVGVGIPIALGLYRWQERRSAATESSKEEKQREKLLILARAELEYNKRLIAENSRKVQDYAEYYLGPRLKTELWSALSDGGELHRIQDLGLMATLAEAYYRIEEAVFLEGRHTELVTMPQGNKHGWIHQVCDNLYQVYRRAGDATDTAITNIDTALGQRA